MQVFNNPMISLLNKNLDGLWLRQELISDNMANYETPGYKRKYVSFEQQLLSVMDGASKNSEKIETLEQSSLRVEEVKEESLRLDGNNVDLEKESVEMARTSLNYMYSQRMINDYFSQLRYVISEGRK